MRFSFTLPWPPAGVNTNNQWRRTAHGIRQLPEALAYKNTVAVLTRQAYLTWIDQGNQVLADAPLMITLEQHQPNRRKRDVDSNVKIVLDGVAMGLGIDDSRFLCLVSQLQPEPDKENPRIEVIVEDADA